MLGIFNTILFRIRYEALKKGLASKIISKAFSISPLGRMVFKLSIFIKRLAVLGGSFSQRAVEYPWVITQTKNMKSGSLVLDIGSAESLLAYELIAKKLRVVGLDIQDNPFKSKEMLFLKRNVMKSGLPDEIFDGIIVVSTIEHIGLKAYGQLTLADDGDTKTMRELHRLLKPQGIVILTTPYIGSTPLKICSSRAHAPPERNYNRERLEKIIEGFQIVREEYFYPKRMERRLYWVKMDREQIDEQKFTDPGIACLLLKKYGKS